MAAAPPLFPDIPSLSDSAELAALIAASITGIAIRTRYYDSYLFTACATGCRQVVLLAAGLDTRAFRLVWPDGVRIFELDLPGLFAFKEPVLAEQAAVPSCERRVVPADLRQDWPARLTAAGFDPSAPSAWAAEGLLVYLSSDEAVRLLTAVGDLSARASRLSVECDEFAEDSTLSRARAMPGMEEVASMWQGGGLGQYREEWLSQHGWQVRTSDRRTLAASYGRELSDDAAGRFLIAIRN